MLGNDPTAPTPICTRCGRDWVDGHDCGNILRGFAFMIAFWGDEHRRYFTDWLLPSLLTKGNVPALENKAKSRFLIATSNADWNKLKNDPNFATLAWHVAPLLFSLDDKLAPIARCGKAFATMTDYAHHLGMYGVMLTPDQVWANNNVAELQKIGRAHV